MNKNINNKNQSLGMNHATAANRLKRDLLFYFVTKDGIVCHHCNKPMERDNFSIEHIVPWLYAENAVELFFDLKNITFAHLKCNILKRRIPEKLTAEEIRIRRNERNAEYRARTYCPIKRKERYIEKGY